MNPLVNGQGLPLQVPNLAAAAVDPAAMVQGMLMHSAGLAPGDAGIVAVGPDSVQLDDLTIAVAWIPPTLHIVCVSGIAAGVAAADRGRPVVIPWHAVTGIRPVAAPSGRAPAGG